MITMINNPIFIRCSREVCKVDTMSIVNHPVNLDKCVSIRKEDNGAYESCQIRFIGCEEDWVYPNKDERNKDFDAIMKIYGRFVCEFNTLDEAKEKLKD